MSWYTNMAAVSLFWNTNIAAVTSCENALLCVEFPQVQYIDLSEIVHVVKANVIVTSERLYLHVRTLFVCEVSPE